MVKFLLLNINFITFSFLSYFLQLLKINKLLIILTNNFNNIIIL
jgi:hypothetical protein